MKSIEWHNLWRPGLIMLLYVSVKIDNFHKLYICETCCFRARKGVTPPGQIFFWEPIVEILIVNFPSGFSAFYFFPWALMFFLSDCVMLSTVSNH